MKNFFKYVLVVLMYLIGYIAVSITWNLSGILWFIGVTASLLMTAPCVLWWLDYFNNLFDNKK